MCNCTVPVYVCTSIVQIFCAKNRILYLDTRSLDDHDTIIGIGLLELVRDMLSIQICIEILHLVCELLYIVDDDQCIWSTLRNYQKEIGEIFFFHCINIHKIKVSTHKCRNNSLGISPDCMDISDFAIAEILHCKIVHIPCILNRSDI